MSRIPALDTTHANPDAKSLFDAVKAKIGKVPNLFRVMGNSPAVLKSYLTFSEAIATGSLSAAERETLAIAIAQRNACGYCLSAHSFIGKSAGLTPADIAGARAAKAQTPRRQALLTLADKLVVERGHLADADLASAREAGLTDGEILEVIALVALNTFTNYVNHVAGTEIDFPNVDLALAS
ncbi:MAG: peroxidase-related enzyme [Dongiaceae bacterium]